MVYRFKIFFEDYEDIYRVIDIKSGQTFEQLHHAIQDSIGFDKQHLASFYMSDDTWKKGEEITLIDMEENEENKKPLMKDSKLGVFINDPHQKIVYVFDFVEMWTLNLELTAILPDDAKVEYPALVKSVGKAPKQYQAQNRFREVDENEFEEIARNMVGADTSPDLDDEDEDEEDEDFEDEFGAEYGEDEYDRY